MNFENEMNTASKIQLKIDAVWEIAAASKSQVVRERCFAVIGRLERIWDCYASGDGI